jgi:hypothetical protein
MSDWVPMEPPRCPKCGTPLSIQQDVGPYQAKCFVCCPMAQSMRRGEIPEYAGPLGVPYDLRNLKYYKRKGES